MSIAIAIDDRRRCREADVRSSHDEVLLRSSQVEGTLSTESVNEVILSKSPKRQALGSVKMQIVDTQDQQKGRQTERVERGNKVGIMTSTVRERESRINLNSGRSPRGKAKERGNRQTRDMQPAQCQQQKSGTMTARNPASDKSEARLGRELRHGLETRTVQLLAPQAMYFPPSSESETSGNPRLQTGLVTERTCPQW